MCIMPLASICGSSELRIDHRDPGQIELVAARLAKISASRAARIGLKARRAEIAQHRVIAGLVGLVEREQGRADQDHHAVAIDLRGLGRLRRRRLLLGAGPFGAALGAGACAVCTGACSCACGDAPDMVMTAMAPAARITPAITPAVGRRSKEVTDLLPTTTRRSRQPECPRPPYWSRRQIQHSSPRWHRSGVRGAEALPRYCFRRRRLTRTGRPPAGAHDRCIETHPDRPVGLKLIAARLVQDAGDAQACAPCPS